MFNHKSNINKKEILKFGFLGGVAEAVYCLAAAELISVLDKATSKSPSQIFGPLLILLFLVFSVGISGLFVFGYPAYLAFQKRFAESVLTAVISLVTLVITGVLTSIVIFSV